MENVTLRELMGQQKILFEMLTQAREDGDDETPFIDTLEALEIDTAEKIDGYVYVKKAAEMEAAGLRAKADALQEMVDGIRAHADAIDAKTARMLSRLAALMLDAGQKNIKTGTFSVSARETVAVDIPKGYNVADLPASCTYYTAPQLKPNKAEIKAYLAAGNTIDGVTLKKNHSVTIR